MAGRIRRLLLMITLILLVPALAAAQLQTGDGLPAELSAQASERMQKGTYRYAFATCDGVDNALLLVRLQNHAVLQFYQKENGKWSITNIASDFYIPLDANAVIGGEDRRLTVTVPPASPAQAKEQFLFTWDQADYVLRSYTLRHADGTGMTLLLDTGGATLTMTTAADTTPSPPVTIKKTSGTAFLFAPIYTGYQAENRGGHNLDSNSFYTALYAAQQAAGWLGDSQTATIAIGPSVLSGLNLRTEADAGAATRGTFFGGVTVQILQDQVSDRSGGLWCEVQIGDLTGYMKRSYLSFTPGDHGWNTAAEAPNGQTNAASNVYHAADDGQPAATLPAKTPVTLLGMSGNQYYISCVNGYGYVAKSQITLSSPETDKP